VVDVLLPRVVGGVETGCGRAAVVGDADVAGSGAGALVGDGVVTGLVAGAAEVADDVPRTGVATGAFEEGAATWLPFTWSGGDVTDEELRDEVGADGFPGTLVAPSGTSDGSATVAAGSRMVVATAKVVVVVAAGVVAGRTDGSVGSSLRSVTVVCGDEKGSASLPVGSCLLSPTWLRSAAFAAAAAPETITMLQIVAAISSFRRDGMRALYEAT
jgi:hypothetical protein